MIRERLRRIGSWTRAALFTLFIHGVIIYLIFFGLGIHQERLEAEGRPVQAVVVNQQDLDRNREEEKRKLEELERKRKEEEQRLAEEQKREEEARKRRESILSNCEKLVLEEEMSGEVNHDLDGLCERERQALKEQRAEEERQRQEEERRRQEEEQKQKEEAERKRKTEEEQKQKEEAERKRKVEEEWKQKEEAERKRKAEEERKQKEEAERKRKAEEERKQKEEAERKRKAEEERKQKEEAERKRKAEEERKRKEEAERLLAEQKLKEQLAAEHEARLAAQTEKDAANALSAAAGRIRSSIEENWRRPGDVRGLKVVIKLRVGRNGEVQNARIVESSGDTRFDESAELAVKKASPLPIPKEPEYYDHIKEFRIEFNPDE